MSDARSEAEKAPLSAQERGLQHLMAEAFMQGTPVADGKPASLSKEQIAKDQAELRKLGFGDCEIHLSKDGHKISIVGPDGKPVVMNDKDIDNDAAIHKMDQNLLAQTKTGEKKNSDRATADPNSDQSAQNVDGKKKPADKPMTPGSQGKPGESGGGDGGNSQDIPNNQQTDSQTVKVKPAGGDTTVTVDHTYKKTFIGAEQPRTEGQSSDVTVTGNRTVGGVAVEAGVSTPSNDPRGRSAYVSGSYDTPEGGTVTVTRGNHGQSQVGYAYDLGDGEHAPTVGVEYDTKGRQVGATWDQKVNKHVHVGVEADREKNGKKGVEAHVNIVI